MPTLTPLEALQEEMSVEVKDGSPNELAHILLPHYTPEMVMFARMEGTIVKAWCGYEWAPVRDPKKLPLCIKCKTLHKEYDKRPLEYS